MTRAVKEWIGATDDTAIPARVKLRVFEASDGRCAHCDGKLGVAGWNPEYDHIIALVNGGENRENNLQCLCRACHKPKTAEDVAIKSRDRSVKAKHLGIKRSKSPLPGGKDSQWKRKVSGEWVRR